MEGVNIEEVKQLRFKVQYQEEKLKVRFLQFLTKLLEKRLQRYKAPAPVPEEVTGIEENGEREG